jgi:hypothetical protein
MMPASWKVALHASRGVYHLAYPRIGEHRVDPAYREDGSLGRWQTYATNNHGGNVGLQIRDPNGRLGSVAEVAGSAAGTDDIIALGVTWKAKLFNRDIGLNRN